MSISQAHHRFVELLKFNEALNNPQDFLGPNTDQLLDFWLRLDGLSFNQWETISRRYSVLYLKQHSEWKRAVNEALDASKESIGEKFTGSAAGAVWVFYNWAATYSTLEIIGNVENPVFLHMFNDL